MFRKRPSPKRQQNKSIRLRSTMLEDHIEHCEQTTHIAREEIIGIFEYSACKEIFVDFFQLNENV